MAVLLELNAEKCSGNSAAKQKSPFSDFRIGAGLISLPHLQIRIAS